MTAKLTADEIGDIIYAAEDDKKKIEELRQKMEEFKTLYLQSEQRANQAIAQIKSYDEKNRIMTERSKAFDTEADETEGETRATHTEEKEHYQNLMYQPFRRYGESCKWHPKTGSVILHIVIQIKEPT